MQALVASIAPGNGCHRHRGFPRSQVCIACPFLDRGKPNRIRYHLLTAFPSELATVLMDLGRRATGPCHGLCR